MTAAASSNAAPARVVLAAGTARYASPEFEPLQVVPKALATVVEALRARGFVPLKSSSRDEVEECVTALGAQLKVPDSPGFVLNPDPEALQASLAEAARAAPVVVVYYTGHGVKPEAGPYRVVACGDPDKPQPFVRVADLLDDLTPREPGSFDLEAEQPDVLVILDCCYSGAVSGEVLSAALRESSRARMWVLATARAKEPAKQGRFAEALVEALDEADVGTVMPYIPMSEVIRLIQKRLPSTGMNEQHLVAVPPNGTLTGDVEPFFPNPGFRPEVAEGVGEGLPHWLSRVRGLDERADLGLYLAGRQGRVHAASAVADWMGISEGPGLAVVTGSPGSGKSTLLAVPALLTGSEDTRTLLTAASVNGNDFVGAIADRVPLETSLVAVHARGLTSDAIARQIAEHLGPRCSSAGDLVTRVVDEEADITPSVLLVDAVDEASQPGDVVRSLLEPLSRHPDVKVLLAARRNVLPSVRDEHLLVDLDSAEYQDPDALTDYIAELLTATCEPDVKTPYQEVAPAIVRQVATALAVQASAELPENQKAESFLLGRLLAVAVRSRPEPVDPTRPDWLHHLPASVGDAFDEDMNRRLGDEVAQGRALLTALAWSRGVGLPREGIWSAVAQALSGHSSTSVVVTEDDMKKILNRARSYVVESSGPGGRTVYRLFHALLAQHLRDQPTQEQAQRDPGLDESWKHTRQDTESAITSALLTTGPRTVNDETDWELAHPYLRTHLAEHAAAAGGDVLHRLLTDPDFLAVADPSTLTPLLDATNTASGRIVRVYRRAQAQLGDLPSSNAAVLAEAAQVLRVPWPESGLIVPNYSTLFSLSPRDDSVLSFWTQAGHVSSLAFATVSSGRTVLLVGDVDGGLQVWDAGRGVALSPRFREHSTRVTSIATGHDATGASIVVTGDVDDESVAWRVDADGQLVPQEEGALPSFRFEGGTLPDGSACTRDPVTGQLVTTRSWTEVNDGVATVQLDWSGGYSVDVALEVATSDPVAVALSSADGEVLLGLAAQTGSLALWNWNGDRIGDEQRVEGRPRTEAFALAVGDAAPGPAATGGWTGIVRVWDMTATSHLEVSGFPIDEVALVPDDPPLLAVATHDAEALSVRMLDATTGLENQAALDLSLEYVVDALLSVRSRGHPVVCAYSAMESRVDVLWLDLGLRVAHPVPFGLATVAAGSGEDGPALIALGMAHDGTPVVVLDAESGAVVTVPVVHKVIALDVIGVGDEVLVVIATLATCALYRLGLPEPLTVMETGSSPATCLRLHLHEGRLLLAVGYESGHIEVHAVTLDGGHASNKLWSGAASEEAVAVTCMVYSHSADGLALVTGSEGGTVAVFSAVSGYSQLQPLQRRGQVRSVHALHSGELVIHDDDGLTIIRVWPSPIHERTPE